MNSQEMQIIEYLKETVYLHSDIIKDINDPKILEIADEIIRANFHICLKKYVNGEEWRIKND